MNAPLKEPVLAHCKFVDTVTRHLELKRFVGCGKRSVVPVAKFQLALSRNSPWMLARYLRWTPLSRPIYGQSKLSVKASLQGYCSYRITLLYVSHLLPCRLMDITAPSH